ncbi:MAG: pyridoxal-phosphate dependent enzyme [Cyclobacteriaceae bacterium]
MITKEAIRHAYDQIQDQVLKTPVVYSPELSKISGANVHLKMECLQHTGSFKLRGALTKILNLSVEECSKTQVAASTGNHATAFAHVTHIRGMKSVLFLPEGASPAKVKALEQYSADIRYFGARSMETEQKASEYAKEIDGVLIHPYNDSDIITGQGTIGVEVEEQVPDLDIVMCPIGGGGLISGLASYFSNSDTVGVVGSQPENAAEMFHSIQQGHIVDPSQLETIADATAGGLEDDSLTFDICRKELAGIDLCTEDQIKEAVAFMVKNHQTIVEPGAALSVATLLNTEKYRGKNVVIVLTGKKINMGLLTQILLDYGNDH